MQFKSRFSRAKLSLTSSHARRRKPKESASDPPKKEKIETRLPKTPVLDEEDTPARRRRFMKRQARKLKRKKEQSEKPKRKEKTCLRRRCVR